MANEVLRALLKEYEKKRLKAEMDLEERKINLHKSVPKLEEIEQNLSRFAISIAKETLNNNKDGVEKLNKYIESLKKQKNEILKKEKIDSSYLMPYYECNVCKDTGYIVKDDYSTEMCHCLKQKILNKSYNDSNMSNLDKENFETFNLKVFSDKVDDRFKISPRKNMEYIKEKCIEFVENFDDPEEKNLLFTGNIGLRKNIYVKLYC